MALAVDLMLAAAMIGSEYMPKGPAMPSTTVQIALGASPAGEDGNTGGNVPHVALFDKWGHRIGQYKGDRDAHIKAGETWSQVIDHDQTDPQGDPTKQPEYIHIVMEEDDAICISYINVAQGAVTWTWVGDWAHQCGKAWYHSSLIVGNGNYQPKCAWIDKNHSNGLPDSSLSLHMPDFSESEALGDEYNYNPATLCRSDGRMQFWTDPTHGDGRPAFFDPPLLYKADGSDLNPKRVINGYVFPKKHPRDFNSTAGRSQVQPKKDDRHQSKPLAFNGTNPWPSHLNVNYIKGLSAKELCHSNTSFGPDFVAVDEGFFCDMSDKKLYPICSDKVTKDCFHLQSQSLIQRRGLSGGSFIQKTYNTTREWHP